jgi:hypothetical protein
MTEGTHVLWAASAIAIMLVVSVFVIIYRMTDSVIVTIVVMLVVAGNLRVSAADTPCKTDVDPGDIPTNPPPTDPHGQRHKTGLDMYREEQWKETQEERHKEREKQSQTEAEKRRVQQSEQDMKAHAAARQAAYEEELSKMTPDEYAVHKIWVQIQTCVAIVATIAALAGTFALCIKLDVQF